MKYFVIDIDGDIKLIIMNKLYEILQFNKRKINRNVKLFNARRAGILIGDELLEFHNYSYHRRTCDKDLEPSWNFNLLGNEYNGVTDKTADDVVRFIEELAGYYKDNPEYEANLCFTEECDNFHFFCHNYHDFVCYINPKIDEVFL